MNSDVKGLGQEILDLIISEDLVEASTEGVCVWNHRSDYVIGLAISEKVRGLEAELDNQRKTCQNFFDENEKLQSFITQLKEMGQEYKDQVSALEAEVKDLMDRDFDKIESRYGKREEKT